MKQKKALSRLILHDIRSVYNVGSIFRTADAAEVEKIYLSGFTPTPIDRFGRKRKDFMKSALGAEESVAWEYTEDILTLIKRLQTNGHTVCAIEQSPKAQDYRNIQAKTPVVLVFGNEVSGLPDDILATCDAIAEIPMRGKKESLNVSVAAGIALFRILDI